MNRLRPIPGRLWRRLRRTPPVLAALVVIALAHGVAWTAITPPLQGPDETTHIAYVQSLVEAGEGPQVNGGTGQYSRELEILGEGLYVLPITQHFEGRPAWHLVDEVEARLDREGEAARTEATGPNAAAGNPPLYYLYAAAVWELTPDRSLLGRLTSVRLATVVPFAITVILAWLIAAELFTVAWARPLVAGIVALNPKLASIAGNVNPDAFLVMLSSGVLLAALRVAQRGLSPPRVIALVALASAAVLTHGRGYFLAPLALIAVGIALLRERPDRRRALVFGGAALAGILVALYLGTSWTREHAAGAAFGGAAPSSGAFDLGEFLSYVWQFYFPGFHFLDESIAGGYGYNQMWIQNFFGGIVNLELNFRPEKYEAIKLGAFLGMMAVWTTAAIRWRTLRDRWPAVVICAAMFLGMVALLHLVSYTSLKNGTGPVITGRYLLVCIPLMGAAIAFVATSLPRVLGVILGGMALGLAALHAIAMLGFGVERFVA
ncbi:MAG TPA: DUF2142 domain-containing protein [Solirubrobacteraceae bacterium]